MHPLLRLWRDRAPGHGALGAHRGTIAYATVMSCLNTLMDIAPPLLKGSR